MISLEAISIYKCMIATEIFVKPSYLVVAVLFHIESSD